MARIPDDIIKRLKQEVSVQRLAEARGVKLKRHGKELMGLCPFHDDHDPSLCIDPEQNIWSCKGACGVGGSPIDWVMKAEGVSFRHAAELLRAEHPALLANSPVVKVGTVRKLPPPVEGDASDAEMLDRIVSYYHETLNQTPDALKYLEQRGLTHPEMIGHFRLGFANRTLGLRLPPKNRKAGAEMRSRLEKLGILRESSGHEHMNGSLVIPIFNRAGELVQMYGRKITANLTKGTPLHLYLPGPQCGVWNEEALESCSNNASPEIILCEALIDALTFWCAGYRNVTASYGVNGFTDDHRAAFRKYGVKRVYIAYDRDEAGDKAALALAGELTAADIECFRVLFPRSCDANEYARTTQPAAKALGVLLNSAQWMGKGRPPAKVEPAAVSVAPVPADEPPAAKEETQPVESAAEEEALNEPEPLAKEAIDEPVPSLAAEPAAHEAALPPVPAPRISAPEAPVEIGAEEIAITLGDRRYRVRGLAKNLSYDLIKINLLVSRGDGFHVDTLDLYAARQRIAFAKQAAIELSMKEEVIRHDLGHVLRKLEEIQQEQIRKALEPKREEIVIAGEEHTAAMELLKAPDLLGRILGDFALCGVVGEETNKLAGYIAAVSRHLDGPLAVIVQSSSAAGKSSLMDSILAFVPPEHRIEYSAMTGQSLFYMGEQDLKHKVLAIVEEQGASRAAYALKLLQSEGVLTIASTGKDPVTGRLVTQQYRVEGPVMIFLTTTAIDIDEELLNRCLVLTVNEDRAQTQAIHRIQRERQTIEGLMARVEREEILKVHRNAQRLLKPLSVVNPYARELTFPDNLTRTRRDHTKYLALINSITLLHQHQRPFRTATRRSQTISYIEVTLDDIERANKIAHEVLGRSLDELPPQTRKLLHLIEDMVKFECERLKMERADFRFSRRDVRASTRWGDTQLKIHLHRLEELEYLAVHRGGRGQSFVYELLYEPSGEDGRAVLPGLIDVAKLRAQRYDGKKSGTGGEKSGSDVGQSGSGRPLVGGISGGGRSAPELITTGLSGDFPPVTAKNRINGAAGNHGPAVVMSQS